MNSVQIFPGAEGIKQVYQEALKREFLNIVCLSENYDQVIGGFFEKEFSPKVYGHIKTREVLPDIFLIENHWHPKIEKLMM